MRPTESIYGRRSQIKQVASTANPKHREERVLKLRKIPVAGII